MGLDSDIYFLGKLSSDQVKRIRLSNINAIDLGGVTYFEEDELIRLPDEAKKSLSKIEVYREETDWDMIEEELGVKGQTLYGIYSNHHLSFGPDYEHQKDYRCDIYDPKYRKLFKREFYFCNCICVYEFSRNKEQDDFFKFMCKKHPDKDNKLINSYFYKFGKREYNELCKISEDFRMKFNEKIVKLYYTAGW